MKAARSVSSSSHSLPHVTTKVRRRLFAAVFAFTMLATVTLGAAGSASAQSAYGSESVYGTEVYSADAEEAGNDVTVPNTGFAGFANSLLERPLLVWGSLMLLTAAVMLTATKLKKRKQEN